MEENSDKAPPSFSQVIAVRTAVTKRPRKQGGGGNIQAMLAIRVRKNKHGTLRRHSGGPFL